MESPTLLRVAALRDDQIVVALPQLRTRTCPGILCVGGQIRARAWELLVAMLVMESAFGLAGIMADSTYHTCLKDELTDRGLV